MRDHEPNRRELLKSVGAASAAAALLPSPLVARGAAPQVVVIGGGFAGATCARLLKRSNPGFAVTLIEAEAIYAASPMSNAVIAGLREMNAVQFDYQNLTRDGITLVLRAASAIDPHARTVTLADGTKLNYDRLVLAPGIDFRWGAIAGYDQAAAERAPHAWKGGTQIALLRRQIEAMEDGGTVVISAPANPARCPPAPYERASLVAHYLKTKKPRSKVIVLDAKDHFTMQGLFQDAWAELYPGLIEWVPLSAGGSLVSFEVETRTFVTDFDRIEADVANVIPPQKAGPIAERAGVADRTGWCPVDPVTFESKLQPKIHVIGDAAIAGAMPRSAAAAHSQAKICAVAVAKLIAGERPAAPTLTSTCYSMIAPDYAISQRGTYRPIEDQYNEVEGGAVVSRRSAPRRERAREASQAVEWFADITRRVFG